MISIKAEIGQSIWDIAIQEYGDCDGVRQLLIDNPHLNLNDNIAAGSVVKITTSPINKSVVDYLKKKGLKPATAWHDPNVVSGGDFNDDFNNDFNI